MNLSARQLLDPDFAARVSEILDRTGMDPRSLLLEVTETRAIVAAITGSG